mmetsp:Transcript_27043/g.48881  ORF Transcript_27043/g.48881 Transcript_27043/m.48881 type:complete len:917 (+) Transcript_27043:67-2817(+)
MPQGTVEDNIERLQNAHLWDLVAANKIHQVKQSDVDELFSILDAGNKGYITASELMTLQYVENLKLTEKDLAEILADADRDGSGNVEPEEFFDAVTSGTLAFNMVKDAFGKREKPVPKTQVERAQLLEWMKQEHEASTALASLPVTVFILLCFVFFISMHTWIYGSYSIHQSFKKSNPSLQTDWVHKIVDISTLNEWTTNTWIPTYFRQDAVYDRTPGRLMNHNQMIAGSRLMKQYRESGPCTLSEQLTYLFDPLAGECYSQGAEQKRETVTLPYQFQQSVIQEVFYNMTLIPWVDANVEIIEYQTLFLNANMNLMTFEILRFTHGADGTIGVSTHYETWMADAYPNPVYLVPDILLLLTFLRLTYANLKEISTAAAAGFDGIADYVDGRVIVEWMTILYGLFVLLFWTYVYNQIQFVLPASVDAFPKPELDQEVVANSGYLTLQQVQAFIGLGELREKTDACFDVAIDICYAHSNFRLVLLINCMVLVLKFFQSFKANPRLDIIVQTMQNCFVDVVHFFIVFGAIFACYGFSGHFMYGATGKNWSTTAGALWERWTSSVGMGTHDALPGAVQVLSYGWSLSYDFIVSSLVLQMLVGLVFAAYYKVKGKAGDAVTIVQQVRKALATARLTRSFVSLQTIIVAMEDDDYPAHPGQIVTSTSLMRAFEVENMTWQNASYLIGRTAAWVEHNMENPSLDLDDSIRMLGQAKNTALQCLDAVETTQKGALELSGSSAGAAALGQNMAGAAVNHDDEEETKPTAELVLASLDNLIIIMEASRKEQKDSAEYLKNTVRRERTTAESRDKALKQELEEFKTRLNRANRCIDGLGQIFQDMQFGSLAGIPERMEQQIMLSFGSRLTLASSNAKPGDLLRLEQRVCDTLRKIHEISSEGESVADARQMLWNIQFSLNRLHKRLNN